MHYHLIGIAKPVLVVMLKFCLYQCLFFPHLDQVCLAPCTTNQTSWLLDESGRLTCGSNLALDVPWEKPRTAVILYLKHHGQNQKWWLLSALKKIITDDNITTVPPSLLHIVQCHAQPDLQLCTQTGGKYCISG